MLNRLGKWFEHRTGYRRVVSALLIEHIPGGAKWRYVWGSCLALVFSIQLLTGLLLMTAYSPGDSSAWGSVYFIQYQMDFGWLIRGLHHFGSQTMVVLLAVHMLQVVIAGAHLPPREVNWWLGLLLLSTVLALSLTGYLLPWDQKGYWATRVATNIAGNLPLAGPWLQKIIVGGPEYGHHTLSRFYTLHVGILPPLVIILTVLHLVVFRRHGVTTPRLATGEGWFWPDQAFRDLLVGLVIFAVMLGLVLHGDGHKVEGADAGGQSTYERWAHAGQRGLGANLDAPADLDQPYPARPEWYFLFLFQMLKYFEGEQEVYGTVVIPNGVLLLLALLPLLGYGRMRKFGHVFGILVVVGLIGGAGALTVLAMNSDRKDVAFQQKQKDAEKKAERAVQVAGQGIPAEGAVYLLRRDPLTQGPILFKQHCAVCHNYGDQIKSDKPAASDLEDYGTEKWVRDLLRDPAAPRFFGHTPLTGMTNWVKRAHKGAKKEKDKQELEADLDTIARWLGGHPRRKPAEDSRAEYVKGYKAFEDRCMECHGFAGEGGGTGPDFTGYGDEDWLRLMLMMPSSKLRYGTKNTMPAFRDLEGPAAEVTRLEMEQHKELLLGGGDKDQEKDPAAEKKRKAIEEHAFKAANLSDVERELIIRWLVKDYRVVFGGAPISGAPRPAPGKE